MNCPRCRASDQDPTGFCASCDYPLFFLPPPPEPEPEPAMPEPDPVPALPEPPRPDLPPPMPAPVATAPLPPADRDPTLADGTAVRVCASCLHDNPPGASFCERCHQSLDAALTPLFDADAVAMPPPATSSSAAIVLSVLALLVAIIALVIASLA